MTKKLIYAVATIGVLVGSTAAQAFGDIINVQPNPESSQPGSYRIENVPVKQNPMDYSRINESPIRGTGRISVVHNEPAPAAKKTDNNGDGRCH